MDVEKNFGVVIIYCLLTANVNMVADSPLLIYFLSSV